MNFNDLPLDHRLVKAVEIKGFEQTTEIQAQAIPHALLGKDLLASSKTGSGKTLAFLLPAIHRLLKTKALSSKDPRVLILAPTRELAKQVYLQLRSLIDKLPLQAALILGGENFNDQVKVLRKNPHFIVGTAGRVADHLEGRSLYLNGLELLILDEADRMLDLGFAAQLKQINRAADHRKRQTMMFSATLDNAEFHYLSKALLKGPHKINIDQASAEHKDIQQSFYLADHLDHKEALLQALLTQNDFKQLILFTATREDTDRLAKKLAEWDYSTLALSGDMDQAQRSHIMNQFSRGQAQCLVTTDVASRGLDLANVSLVINFDLPKLADEYVHRVGRTGRAGNKGQAMSLVGPKDWRSFEAIKAFLEQQISFSTVEGLEGKFKGLKPQKGKKPGQKKTSSIKGKTAKSNKPAQPQKRIRTMQGKEVGDAPMLRRKKPIEPDGENEE